MTNVSYHQPFANYPSQKGHEQNWEILAKEIAASRDTVINQSGSCDTQEQTNSKNQKTGELIIIGSGIEAVGFTTHDEKLIQTADKVFYCVADPATVVWLKALRPDAYDLYVLYDDTKVRYTTYMQMTEALLYYVRQGQKVVGVYYGHPGIFVLSSHRAIKIARREGYQAIMRAGISALDTLCADLGVDPSQPGMQTFEATDMLIRSRIPDTSLHVVLWQVGLIGELGYRRSGYINGNLSVLIEYLQKHYGEDYPVTNYIASRYPGIEPTIEVYTLQQLHDPEIQSKVTGISTFYIAPQKAAIADVAMMERLGMIKPETIQGKNETLLRQIDQYGDREMAAFKHFKNFKIPKGYHWQEDTAAARFILALRDDMALRETYCQNPERTIAENHFPGLSDREKILLSNRNAGSLQLAAKGINDPFPLNQAFIKDLFCQKNLAKSLRQTINQVHRSVLTPTLEQWSEEQVYTINWQRLGKDFDVFTRRYLYPWSGVYLSHHPQYLIVILGSKRRSQHNRVYINETLIHNIRFQQGKIQWSTKDGNPHNGYVHVDIAPNGNRRLAGTIWAEDVSVPANYNFVASFINPNPLSLCRFIGDYKTEFPDTTISLRLNRSSHQVPKIDGYRNNVLLETSIEINENGLKIDDFQIPFRAIQPQSSLSQSFWANYRVRAIQGKNRSLHWFDLTDGHLKIDDQFVGQQSFSDNQLSWSAGPANFATGSLNFLIDPISLLPMCYGNIARDRQSEQVSLTGMEPVPENYRLREEQPAFGLPLWAWKCLLGIMYESSQKGGLFLWNTWEQNQYAYQVLQKTLSKIKTF